MHGEMFRHLPWPFQGGRFPAGLGAVVQLTVLTGEEPARLVLHDSDGSWAVGDGRNDPNGKGASLATHMAHVLERNSSVAELATMPPGNEATRTEPGSPWAIRPFAYEE
jgi:hypothetical protein